MFARAALLLSLAFTLAACHDGGSASGSDPDGGTSGDGGNIDGSTGVTTASCPAGDTSAPLSAQTTRGVVRGVAAGQTTAFLGVPYAAPPVGSLRFRPPEVHACWSDVRDAQSYGADCLQRDVVTGAVRGDEDCLFLNVWTPSLDPTAKLPVLFWVHGGANVLGSANQRTSALAPNLYDGQALATREHAVVVSINYRLGPMGFLAHALLDAESAHHASGDYAIHDQLAALKWAQDNIQRFGGDPDRVMLFGESAGAMNTCVLLTSPLASGLFSRALMESGDCSAQPTAKAEAAGAALVTKLGCADLDCLRQLSGEQIIAATTQFTLTTLDATTDLKHGLANTLPWGASIDGWSVPADPMTRLIAGQQNKVPLVIGSNAQEMALFLIASQTFSCAQYQTDMNTLFGADAGKVLTAYPCALDGRAAEVAALTDLAMTCPARRIARAWSAAGTPTFRYYFRHVASYGPTVLLGAYHASELAYVFDSFAAMAYLPIPAEQSLSDAMQDRWGTFAATATPNGGSLSTWPTYSASNEQWLSLDNTIAVESDSKTAECDLWGQILGW